MKKIIILILVLGFSGINSLYAQQQNSVEFSGNPFVITVKTNNSGVSGDTQFEIPTFSGEAYNYEIDWTYDGVTFNAESTGVTGDALHDYGVAGTYTIAIRGTFPRIYFNNNGQNSHLPLLYGDSDKLMTIEQWGDIQWSSMERAFYGCDNFNITNPDIDTPDLSNATSTAYAFAETDLNGDISAWDVSTITNMSSMFSFADDFNQDISQWDVFNVTSMKEMFAYADDFNQDISQWNVSNVTNMSSMFEGAYVFNQDIGNWDVGNVIDMVAMFAYISDFNQDLSNWDVSSVESMKYMFEGAINFDGDISNWNTAQVTNMSNMFNGATNFNQDISGWNVARVTDMEFMFNGAANFNQDISGWNVSNVENFYDMFQGSAFSQENYDNLLIGWSQLPSLYGGVGFGTDAGFCLGETAKQNIITNYNWTFTDGGMDCDDIFITQWETTAPNTTITIPFLGASNLIIDWGDGTIESGLGDNPSHNYINAGEYIVSVSGRTNTINFNNGGDRLNILELIQWGSNRWTTMDSAFAGCANLDVTATDTPNLSNTDALSEMFAGCTSLVGTSAFASWITSNVTVMSGTFEGATSFNQDIGSWDTGQVTDLSNMFNNATSFDQSLGAWDISNINEVGPFSGMRSMFENAGISTENYDNTLIGWATLDAGETQVPLNIVFDGGNSHYCLGETARNTLTDPSGLNWTITDGGLSCPTDIFVAPKVYLQGAAVNPNAGEETLMRDDFRVANTSEVMISPYGDAAAPDDLPAFFSYSGPGAFVDWVWVELRDKDDPSVVIAGQSGMLTRNGNIVDPMDISLAVPLNFYIPADAYYVVVKHRNHVGIMSSTAVSLSGTVTEVDLSSDPSMVEGGSSSVVLLANGSYGMYTGDYDANAQIQNTDAYVVVQLIGGSGYEDADMDLNTQIQNTDVNVLISPNIGRGEQFGRPSVPTEQLSTDVTLAFANAQITNDGVDDYYEADIVISGTTDFYVGSGQVYLDYATAAFGENISANGSIEYSQPDGSILGYSFGAFSPAYRDFIENDNITSRVSLSFQQNVGITGLETAPELQITSTPKVLFHIKIRYTDVSEDAGMCFYSDGIFQDQFFTACGGTATADCTTTPGVQITDDSYDCSEAGVDTLGMTSLEGNEIFLYPNPVGTSFRIKGLGTMSQIRIYDVSGRLIVEELRNDKSPIDMSAYDDGVYLVKITSGSATVIKRLIKKSE
ncbi:BspA family leucine-rich repeat surface protein [Winogradskyella sp.]|uniref:BspA family leucine-rich repeat surface protein n=1 Tax=Winogradskyella sp. TaxID=1883156 RepID=UPI003BAA9271